VYVLVWVYARACVVGVCLYVRLCAVLETYMCVRERLTRQLPVFHTSSLTVSPATLHTTPNLLHSRWNMRLFIPQKPRTQRYTLHTNTPWASYATVHCYVFWDSGLGV